LFVTRVGHEVIVAHAQRAPDRRESEKDDRLDARMLARLVRIDPQLLAPVKQSQCAGASGSDGDPCASGSGTGADVVDQYGAGTLL
jgi:hypothetical protein